MPTLTDSRTDHTTELRATMFEETFGDGPMIENHFAIQYENYCEDLDVGNEYQSVHDFEDTSTYTSNLERRLKIINWCMRLNSILLQLC